MNTATVFIPTRNSGKRLRHSFHWTVDNHLTKAHACFFHLTEPPFEEYWHFIGSTGTLEEHGKYFSFNLAVPYIGKDLLERTYTLDDGLLFYHVYSVTYPDFIELRTVAADYAETTIRLDPKAGTVQGDFNAKFKNHPDLHGTFQLKRNDQ